MRWINLRAQDEEVAFAKKAADYFGKDPKCRTFTDGEIKPGCLFAIRWGGGDDCVAVFKLDESHEPTCYENIIKTETS